ncbi:MAG: membrane protein insertase YidC [Thermomicrobiales bacterium]|nr:membrane protein insertase YidC [Thermomicrobiales bacterium]
MDLTSFPALLAQLSFPSIPIWDQYVQLLVQALNGLTSIFHSAGLAIIAFTIIIKTIMLPLTVKSIRSSKAMQDLQPKIKELQKKHGSDRQRISQETMALYQQHRVNPMAGCLPMIIQIPIFLGLYQSIMRLSTSGSGLWNEGFLWLPSLAHPDPIHLLPILAGIFQFTQTQMMRPANQPKSTDPQQAMMNSVMNIMPLTVVFFGWNFAAGPVLYWATQSVYSVIQQWFITGWGSVLKWVPFLPELPEHRRLGYRPPRSLDEVVVVSGEGEPVYGPGPMGWLQKKMNEAQQMAMERAATAPADSKAAESAEPEAVEASATVKANGSGAKARGGKGKGKRPAGGKAAVAATASKEPAATGAPAGAVIVPRKAKAADGANTR